jgi:hypothetical protein
MHPPSSRQPSDSAAPSQRQPWGVKVTTASLQTQQEQGLLCLQGRLEQRQGAGTKEAAAQPSFTSGLCSRAAWYPS